MANEKINQVCFGLEAFPKRPSTSKRLGARFFDVACEKVVDMGILEENLDDTPQDQASARAIFKNRQDQKLECMAILRELLKTDT